MKQGTPQWYTIRCGVPTASNFDKIITSKGEPSKQARKYLYKTAGESLTEVPEETYQNQAMIRGIEMEDEARSLYELITGTTVKKVGFCLNDKGAGCSPDGLVGDDGGIQIKCPSIAVHVGYLLDGKLPTDYFQQVQGEMYVTDRKWWDFVSYYPGLRPLIIRVERDEEFIKKLHNELNKFCKDLKDIINKIK